MEINCNIDDLDVSNSWKHKFKVLEKIGANHQFIYQVQQSDAFKALSFTDKRKIILNFTAFIFGPLYYIFKKMWLKGFVLSGCFTLLSALLSLIEIVLDTTFAPAFYWAPGAAICGQLANYDYYKRVVYQEKMWGKLAVLSNPLLALTVPVFAFGLLAMIVWHSQIVDVKKCDNSDVTTLVRQIAEEQAAAHLGEEIAKTFTYSVQDMQTTATNRQTGAHDCSANIGVTGKGDDYSVTPVLYTVENIDDGENIYTSVTVTWQ